ncbi:MAG: molecular chaperone SurA [Gammaproteobacteria bacterium]|nr:MAG: molecular chaperone SurA [Gammaproteobacteria bacterium]
MGTSPKRTRFMQLLMLPLHTDRPKLLAVIGLFLLVAVSDPGISSDSIDRVVAVVNQDIITESELRHEVMQTQRELRAKGQPIPPIAGLKVNLLESMIVHLIQIQRAEFLNITVADEMVMGVVNNIAQNNQLSLTQLQIEIERDGLSFGEYIEDIRDQIAIRRLVDQEVARQITVTDQEIDEFLIQYPDTISKRPTELDLSHILIAVPADATEEDIASRENRTRVIQDEISGGLAFSDAAMLYSDSPDGAEGGRLGWRLNADLPTQFVKAVSELEVGMVSSVIRSPRGFHIVQLLNRRGGEENLVEQSRVRHIVLVPNVVSGEAQIRVRLERIRQRILAGAPFSEMATLHSQDQQSRVKGGDLGWLSPGDSDGEFEKVASELAVGEVSTVFQTGAGFHLVQLDARRTRNMSGRIKRSQARQQVRTRKVNEKYEEWLGELRDIAYIEYRVALDDL